MTNVITRVTADAVTTSASTRWWRRARSGRAKWQAGRRRRLSWFLATVATIAAAVPAVLWYQEPPRRVPRFEAIVDDTPGPVKDFTLTDVAGAAHSAQEWANRSGIVLFFLGLHCTVTDAFAPEITRLARRYGERGIAFYGLYCDPGITAESAAAHAPAHDLPFPILLDPDQRIARQAGVRVTPEAVVLASDGQVLYRGRINDLYTPDGRRQRRVQSHDLATALDAIVAGELPRVSHTDVFGSPLQDRRSPSTDTDLTITFTRHVAPILWRNCAKCHRPGAVAPFSLLSYNDAARRADFIRDVVSSGQMPPWKPHPGAGVFLDAPPVGGRERDSRSAGLTPAVPRAIRPSCRHSHGSTMAGSSARPTLSSHRVRPFRSARAARTPTGRLRCPSTWGVIS